MRAGKTAQKQAGSASDAKLARRPLERLAASLDVQYPSVAASIREGVDEPLTLQGLEICAALYRTLRSTSAIENLSGGVATYTRNVKRWHDPALGRRSARRNAARLLPHPGTTTYRSPKLVAALTRHGAEVGQQEVA